jgi:pilus assembly protein CpaF
LDPQITEVLVNGPDKIFIEQQGRLHRTDRSFMDEKQLRVVIDRIVAPLGRRVDESSPLVDARLPDGSRVHIVIPPIALDGATLSIRKFPAAPMRMVDILRKGSLTGEMAAFLEACVRARLNVFISGGTSSGKTTLLNVLSACIPEHERIVTIEDSAELKLNQQHVVRLESRPPNIEGTGAITIRDLVRASLRMRPDRIIVGEVRSGEAFDMLQAMNTGHDGSLCTGHANAPRDALARLENMVLMSGLELPVRAIREQIASAIHLIVQQDRLEDGSRKVVRITEIVGMEGDIITTQDVFVYERRSLDSAGRVVGVFKPTGLRPRALERMAVHGVPLPVPFASPEAS